MKLPVNGTVFTGCISKEIVHGKESPHEVRPRLEYDVNAPAKVVLDRRPIPVFTRHDFYGPAVLKNPPFRPWPQHVRKIMGTNGGKLQSTFLRNQPGRVAEGAHFYG